MARPEAMAGLISRDLQSREEALRRFLNDPEHIKKFFSGTLSPEEVKDLSEAPFYIYAFERDRQGRNILIFWNSNKLVSVCDPQAEHKGKFSLLRDNGVYLRQCITLPQMEAYQYLVVLFPVATNYPLQNQYLRSSFAAADYIPPSTLISDTAAPGSMAVKDKGGHPLFYLDFKGQDLPKWIPDALLTTGLCLALFFSLIWLHLTAIRLSENRSPLAGLGILTASVLALLLSVYCFPLPFYLGETAIFSPQLYAASAVFPSLGVLLTDMICLLWILIYLMTRFRWPSSDKTAPFCKSIILLFILIFLAGSAVFPIYVFRTLVVDSRISFDVSNFYGINGFTVVGLVAVCLISGISCLMIYGANRLFNRLSKRIQVKYLWLLIAGGIVYLIYGRQFPAITLSVFWLILFSFLLDLRKRIRERGLFASEMIFWATFIALSATVSIQYFIEVKEGFKRKLFAESIVRQKDNMMEFLFEELADSIRHNKDLQAFIDAPSQEARTIIEENLTASCLRNLNRYEIRFYIFDHEGKPLYNPDTVSLSELQKEKSYSEPAGSRYLFFREHAKNGHSYLAFIPLKENGFTSGYLFLDLALKKTTGENVYPELLQSARFKELQNNAAYSYAVYSDRELTTQAGDHPFPGFLKKGNIPEDSVRIIRGDGYNIEAYQVGAQKTVLILVPQNPLTRSVTLFSYILGIFMVFAMLAFLIRAFFFYILRRDASQRLFHPTIRNRIHLAMLGVVLISFLVIGIVTIWVFTDRYNETNKTRLRSAIKRVERTVQQQLQNNNVPPDAVGFDTATADSRFKKFVSDLASSQNIDINIYNTQGTLNATSQDDIYNKQLLARLLTPDAYYQLTARGKPLLIQNEQIGRLHYLSGYAPVRNEKGAAIGYINVPFFASEKELNYQISNILVALINFYAVVFLISSFFALLITNWITRGLQMVIDRFQKFSLRENEPLTWPHDDEIGLLVKAYNSMVKKVEESTSLLARTERETAWREMARQVAHEIKNPLTPMKLHLQYLQNALKSQHPDILQLTKNVSASLIEQIDNLSHIASAFSDFAKMPEAQPEVFELNETVLKAVDLYINNSRVKVHFENSNEPLRVYADKSQLLRVINNLLQNAVQAIPEDRDGQIGVSLGKEEDTVLISISDNGLGIPEEIREKIFSPYFTTKGSGTGLGLAMSRKIIEFWKGSIWFESEVRKGTCFFIRMPLREASDQS